VIRRHSFFVKSFVGSLLIIVAVVALSGLFAYRTLNAFYLDQVRTNQDRLARVTQQAFEQMWGLPDDRLDALCKAFFEEPRDRPASSVPEDLKNVPPSARLTVIAADGRVLGDSRDDPAKMQNHRTDSRPEVLVALGGAPAFDERISETEGRRYQYLARPIRHGGTVVGAVRIAVPTESVTQTEDFLVHVLGLASAAAVATAILVGLMVSWIWYLPLKQITDAARQIASGDLTSRARIVGADELGRLGAALNELRDNLSQKISLITAQRENLQTIVANLGEGVIAVDAAGRIVLLNPAAAHLLALGTEDVAGKPLRSIVRMVGILDVYSHAMTDRKIFAREIEADLQGRRRIVQALATPVSTPGSEPIAGMIVLRDITDLSRAAAMKAEFVANASHELRTPVATIRAAVDSLASADPSDAESVRELAAILDRHTRRLEQMTMDLLDLHVVESGKKDLVVGDIPLGSLVEWADGHFAAKASQKGVALDVSAPNPGFVLKSDRKLIELVLQNLLDNAIKFTPAGGRVDCRLEPQGGQVRLGVSDTGCGIRPEDQPRVFDRFFQADASRSGDTRVRGTGLGLAIVKHAAERLDARVTLQSEVGKGTTVAVLVPNQA
jgi:two-component system phosphate regulon sensor histidine kinase PhoR